jgi:phosphoglycolate phosphatase-like HAD superfamily hydrolase
MEAARAAGMPAIGAAWGPYGPLALAPLADAIALTPAQALTLLIANR